MTPTFDEQAREAEECGACKRPGLNRTHTCAAFNAGAAWGRDRGREEMAGQLASARAAMREVVDACQGMTHTNERLFKALAKLRRELGEV
jgi:hypothetical protein